MNKTSTPAEVALAVKDLKDKLPALMELAELQSKILAHTFTQAMKNGFNEAQAMQIVIVKASQ